MFPAQTSFGLHSSPTVLLELGPDQFSLSVMLVIDSLFNLRDFLPFSLFKHFKLFTKYVLVATANFIVVNNLFENLMNLSHKIMSNFDLIR